MQTNSCSARRPASSRIRNAASWFAPPARLLGYVTLMWLVGMAPAAHAYDTPPPKYIIVEITWKGPNDKGPRTERGQLWFKDFPRFDSRGRVSGFGKLGYYTGIKWFVPRNPGEIWLERKAVAEGEGDEAARPTFLLHHHFGDSDVVPAFHRIDVIRTMDSRIDKHFDKAINSLDLKQGSGDDEVLESMTLDGKKDEEAESLVVIESGAGGKKRGRKAKVPADKRPSPLRFATQNDIGIKRIAMADVLKIVFHNAADGYKREVYRGRYVQFSNRAKGDEGRVQVVAATYFGSAHSERFSYGGFLNDDSILLAGNFVDLRHVDPKKMVVLGEDPPRDAYPAFSAKDRKGRMRMNYPRTVATLVHYSSDLTALKRVIRLPWGTGTLGSVTVGPDDAVYMACGVGVHFETFASSFSGHPVVENPAALAPPKKGKRARKPRPDSFVIKIDTKSNKVAWLARFKHAGLNIFLRPDGKLLVRRDKDLFFIDSSGSVSRGPQLEITGRNMCVDPRNGSMYFGGSYRSATGLEPWVCPYMYKVDANGKHVWTAWGWTGPIVGVEQFREVSDSAVTRIQVGEDGNLAVVAWSDGGNTVIRKQPYDLRIPAKGGGFCSSTWGATGGLTVRIANLVNMNAENMQVDYFTQYISYLPTSDVPTLLNVYDVHRLPNGDIAVTGASRTGYVETHDAWVKPWYIQYRTNEFAQAKSGTFFTLFRKSFGAPRMATRTPGVSGGRLAGKGSKVLLYCGATSHGSKPGDPMGPIVKRAVQPRNAGGLDGYAILIDTQGKPNPPVIPDWTWGKHKKKK